MKNVSCPKCGSDMAPKVVGAICTNCLYQVDAKISDHTYRNYSCTKSCCPDAACTFINYNGACNKSAYHHES